MKLSQESTKLIVRLLLIGSLLNLIGYFWFGMTYGPITSRSNTNHLMPAVAKGDITVNSEPETIEREDLVLYLEDNRNIISCIVGIPDDRIEIINGLFLVSGSVATKSCLPADLPIMNSRIYIVPNSQYLVYDNAEGGDLNLINKEKIIKKISHVYHLTNMHLNEYLSLASGILLVIIIWLFGYSSGSFYISLSMQVRIFSRRYSSSLKPYALL